MIARWLDLLQWTDLGLGSMLGKQSYDRGDKIGQGADHVTTPQASSRDHVEGVWEEWSIKMLPEQVSG